VSSGEKQNQQQSFFSSALVYCRFSHKAAGKKNKLRQLLLIFLESERESASDSDMWKRFSALFYSLFVLA
jgi:hypothetical protein